MPQASSGKKLTVYLGIDGSFYACDEKFGNSGQPVRFNNPGGLAIAVRTWLEERAREANAEEEQKMAVLRESLAETFAPLLAMQKEAEEQKSMREIHDEVSYNVHPPASMLPEWYRDDEPHQDEQL